MKILRQLTAHRWRERIHDEIGPQIFHLATKAKLLADTLRGKKQREAELIVEELGKLRETLRDWQGGKERPKEIDLSAELSMMAQKAGGRFHDKSAGEIWDQRRGTLLFQIAREAAHNAVKHGRASKVEIFLEVGVLRVEDNGSGRPGRIRAGTGMTMMKRRARQLGGKITLERGKKGGAILTCHFPGGPGL